MSAQIIFDYFPQLTSTQQDQFAQLAPLYHEWNEKINVVSRKDIDELYLHHVLHSLSIARFISFRDQSKILDAGTGGGFPGIPLAIMFPQVEFHLVDSIGKKIMVVQEISQQLQLRNVTAIQGRAEELSTRFDFALTRAVAPLETLVYWLAPLIAKKGRHAIPNGLIALKGGDLTEELKPLSGKAETVRVDKYFSDNYFNEKYVVYFPVMP